MRVDGELQDDGGVWRLRFRRHLPHPAEKVWRGSPSPSTWAPGSPTA